MDFGFSQRARRAVDQPISYLMAQAVANPQLISLAAGLVDYDSLPAEDVRSLLEGILADPASARAALQYGTTEGLADLRGALFEHMARLDGLTSDQMPGSADDVVITTGSQQLLHILADLLLDEGDIVITAWPTYFVFTGALSALGVTVRSVDVDEQGLIPEQLDLLLSQLDRDNQLHHVKMVYLVDYHDNPTGLTLATERRPELLGIVRKWSRHHRILLLEDAAYRELTYRGDAPPSIKSLDTDHQQVALLHTFSKPFAPGLKTGYGLLPRDLIEPVSLSKGGRDFGSTNLCQHLLLRAMQSGAYDRHVAKLCALYESKCNAMLDALQRHMPDGVTWTRPTGGLYVWLTLPEHVDTSRTAPLFAAKLRYGVLAVPGVYCHPPDPARIAPTNHLRLSFGVPTIEQIHEGIARLARALAEVL